MKRSALRSRSMKPDNPAHIPTLPAGVTQIVVRRGEASVVLLCRRPWEEVNEYVKERHK